MIYLTLFFSSFISATLFPLGSEALLVYDILEGYNIFILLFVTTIGNTFGSCVNYYLGFKGESYLEEKRYLSKEKINKYKTFFDKYGFWTLFLSWMPIIGDPITFIAGVLKYNFKYFFVVVLFAKFFRYLFLAFVTLY